MVYCSCVQSTSFLLFYCNGRVLYLESQGLVDEEMYFNTSNSGEENKVIPAVVSVRLQAI